MTFIFTLTVGCNDYLEALQESFETFGQPSSADTLLFLVPRYSEVSTLVRDEIKVNCGVAIGDYSFNDDCDSGSALLQNAVNQYVYSNVLVGGCCVIPSGFVPSEKKWAKQLNRQNCRKVCVKYKISS